MWIWAKTSNKHIQHNIYEPGCCAAWAFPSVVFDGPSCWIQALLSWGAGPVAFPCRAAWERQQFITCNWSSSLRHSRFSDTFAQSFTWLFKNIFWYIFFCNCTCFAVLLKNWRLIKVFFKVYLILGPRWDGKFRIFFRFFPFSKLTCSNSGVVWKPK